MKITKDSLLAENATLKATIAELEKKIEDGKEVNKTVRQDLSAALGSGTTREYTYSDPEPVVWSWSKIFVEVGKLLEKKNYTDLSEAVEFHTNQITGINERLFELDPPKKR